MKEETYKKIKIEDAEGDMVDVIEVTTTTTKVQHIKVSDIQKKKERFDKMLK